MEQDPQQSQVPAAAGRQPWSAPELVVLGGSETALGFGNPSPDGTFGLS